MVLVLVFGAGMRIKREAGSNGRLGRRWLIGWRRSVSGRLGSFHGRRRVAAGKGRIGWGYGRVTGFRSGGIHWPNDRGRRVLGGVRLGDGRAVGAGGGARRWLAGRTAPADYPLVLLPRRV